MQNNNPGGMSIQRKPSEVMENPGMMASIDEGGEEPRDGKDIGFQDNENASRQDSFAFESNADSSLKKMSMAFSK